MPTMLIDSVDEAERKIDALLVEANALRGSCVPDQLIKQHGYVSKDAIEEPLRQRGLWYQSARRMLQNSFSDGSIDAQFRAFGNGMPHDSTTPDVQARALVRHMTDKIAFLERLREELPQYTPQAAVNSAETGITGSPPANQNIFVVHGHDNAAKEAVARLLTKLQLTPVILSEQPNLGRTLIDKFEHNAADIAFAVVLLTPDDYGQTRRVIDKAPKVNKEQFELRARPNVVFEMGFFIGALRRARVCLLLKEGTAKPSDIEGLVYVPMDEHSAWHLALAREIRASGISVDLNLLG